MATSVSYTHLDVYKRQAMRHELTRGLKQGMPFALMEQTPSVSNWLTDNSLKRPGVLRMQSYQAVAHGADTVMFFQMRRSPASCEKFHGAVIDHSGTDNTRVFRECAAIGKELQIIGDKLLGTRKMCIRDRSYDICEIRDLLYYEPGDKLKPVLEETCIKYITFYKKVCEEEHFADLMKKSSEDKCA